MAVVSVQLWVDSFLYRSVAHKASFDSASLDWTEGAWRMFGLTVVFRYLCVAFENMRTVLGMK